MRIAAPMAAVLLGSLIAAQGQTKAAAKPFVYGSHDLFYVVEIPAGWEYSGNEESNEIVITKGDASVSVAVLNNDEGITVKRFLEYRKSILRQQCPAAEFRDQGKGTVAGVAGTAFCPGPGQPTLIRVSAAFNYWKFFVFSSIVPVAELPAVQSDLDRMAASFKAGDGLPEGRAERMRAR